VGIVVVGETPYAEGVGDREDLTLSEQDVSLIELVKERSERIIVILISGRPMVISEHLDQWDAFVAAWLPGTEGQGVADVLFGNDPFTGKLPYTWPKFMDQVPFDPASSEAPLFSYGYGLETGATPNP
jgi:beta-glucosidase